MLRAAGTTAKRVLLLLLKSFENHDDVILPLDITTFKCVKMTS